jgi:hypothetical protein
MGKADLHLHSTYSDGLESVQAILAHVNQHTDLDVIAITDHDRLDGSLLARDLAARGRVQIIVGEELSTRDGHLLALGIEQHIAPGLSMAESITAIHEQGGLAVAAHPLSRWVSSASLETLDALASRLDGLEACNASFAGLGSNVRAHSLNRARYGLAETGGSDAHTLEAIGSSYTAFPGTTAEGLIAALRARTTQARFGYWSLAAVVRYGSHKFWADVRSRLPLTARP